MSDKERFPHLRAEAHELLVQAIVCDERGDPCGTVASLGDRESHYGNVWTRDNVAPMLYFLDEDPRLVRLFLEALMRRQSMARRTFGLIPIGFSPRFERVDYGGEEAIGAIYSIDSTLWFLILIGLYVDHVGDQAWLEQHRRHVEAALGLLLAPRFDPLPLLAAPESVTEIDRPAGLHGYPLQLQILACLALRWSGRILKSLGGDEVAQSCADDADAIASWVNRWYWLDREILNEREDLPPERHGFGNPNPFNLDYRRLARHVPWLQDGGFLAGTIRTRHLDSRFWSLPNCLAATSGIVSEQRAAAIVRTVETHAADLLGEMPMAVCWPELRGSQYQIVMDSDPRGRPGVFHNGAYWPSLLWTFVSAALRAGKRELAETALDLAGKRLAPDWGEYYDRRGCLGTDSRCRQTWSIAGFLLAERTLRVSLSDPQLHVSLMPRGGW